MPAAPGSPVSRDAAVAALMKSKGLNTLDDLENADGAELLPDARALARADENPDAGAVLELLAFVRTHGAADVKTVCRALVDPIAAALDADAARG